MHRVSLRFAPVLIALLMAFSIVQFASASVDPAPRDEQVVRMQSHGEDEEAEEGATDDHGGATTAGEPRDTSIMKVVLWSFSGLGAIGIFLGAFYMLKKKIGGFPENPAWVAPIEVLYSKDAPAEGAYGDTADAHGAHGSHH